MNNSKKSFQKVLEHKTQKVLAFPSFLIRLSRFGLFAFSLVVVSVGFGMLGYWFFADLTLIDSFHMASMILTGMGPVSDMTSNGAKLFSSFYALYSGVAFLSITAVFFAPIIHRLLHILHVEDGKIENH
ncbi:hypothetical protein SAMN03080617_00747 [Algoriphagus alkaliphilus]|uniref:Ion channel n=1 Tax=Algoriphagus alkaliphilus TaxID=279824 RepID=A0A1G5VXY6_9BACT|nr:hypothetical protein [Algoriphagus alkaliphilus]MBA4300296.1 hypothetical protein [Cyclobacterium sp.]SDA50702.1 hypothetical protein SAMN03080617_00747 [Algoriphagus alkaliphilus]